MEQVFNTPPNMEATNPKPIVRLNTSISYLKCMCMVTLDPDNLRGSLRASFSFFLSFFHNTTYEGGGGRSKHAHIYCQSITILLHHSKMEFRDQIRDPYCFKQLSRGCEVFLYVWERELQQRHLFRMKTPLAITKTSIKSGLNFDKARIGF